MIEQIGNIISNIGRTSNDIRTAITGELNTEDKAKIINQIYDIEKQTIEAQKEIQLQEIQTKNFFYYGWRPFLSWVFVCIIIYSYVIYPVISSFFDIKLISLNIDNIWSVIVGLLGLGGFRTIEKINYVQGKH